MILQLFLVHVPLKIDGKNSKHDPADEPFVLRIAAFSNLQRIEVPDTEDKDALAGSNMRKKSAHWLNYNDSIYTNNFVEFFLPIIIPYSDFCRMSFSSMLWVFVSDVLL